MSGGRDGPPRASYLFLPVVVLGRSEIVLSSSRTWGASSATPGTRVLDLDAAASFGRVGSLLRVCGTCGHACSAGGPLARVCRSGFIPPQSQEWFMRTNFQGTRGGRFRFAFLVYFREKSCFGTKYFSLAAHIYCRAVASDGAPTCSPVLLRETYVRRLISPVAIAGALHYLRPTGGFGVRWAWAQLTLGDQI